MTSAIPVRCSTNWAMKPHIGSEVVLSTQRKMTACTDSTIVDIPKIKSEDKLGCAVCGDKSTGKHYWVSTCEGCKSFFKPTVRNSTSYTCRGNNNCTVDRDNRSRCPSCRFQKCLNTGMKKEGNRILCVLEIFLYIFYTIKNVCISRKSLLS